MPTLKSPKKRPPSESKGGTASKRARKTTVQVGASRNAVGRGSVRIKADPDSNGMDETTGRLEEEFKDLFSNPQYSSDGVPNSILKEKFGDASYMKLVPIINDLTRQGRLSMSKTADGELVYNLLSDEVASKFAGLDVSARMVYQLIEKAGNKGIWTKDIRTQTNIQQQALNKIFKALETRRLVKPIKAVTAKSKKLYMLFELTPAKEITGGPWYTESEFDHEFIGELRTFILHLIKRLHGGKGTTLSEIAETMKQAKVSRVVLNLEEVQQLLQTLAFDYKIEQAGVNTNTGEALFIAAKRVTTMCDFQWWDAFLCPDFQYRSIRFEDDVLLSPHEPHHHTA